MSRRRMSPGLFVLVAFALAPSLFLAGCAAKVPPDPFQVPRSHFDAIRTIAMAEVGLPDGVLESDRVKSRIRQLISDELSAAGFTVIPNSEVRRVWDEIRDAAGPLYDPVTGQIDSVKAVAMTAEYRAALQDLGADAFLDPDVLVVRAAFGGGQARWDGTSQMVQSLVSRLMLQKQGVLPALSVCVKIYEGPGAPMLYHHHGGLEVLADHNLKGVPASQLFSDDARTAQAVTLALAPLRDRAAP
jgi:hypothetical protein